jgi:polyphenol oxidase
MPQTSNPLAPIQIPSWLQYPWLRHAFSTRPGGVSTVYSGNKTLNLGFTKEDDPAAVHENRSRLTHAIFPSATLIVPRQIHSALTHTVTSATEPQIEADGLITHLPNILLGIGTADCVPILVVDTRLRIASAFHAGWRGTAARIVESGISHLRQTYSSHPEDLIAAIGPSIGPCCYAVGEEVHSTFTKNFSYAPNLFQTSPSETRETGEPRETPETNLNLWEANRRQLADSGLSQAQITTLSLCTACSRDPQGQRRFFSHRAEHGNAGRMLNVVGIAPTAS